ncbi:hypothetical protein BCR33DRAFT_373006 [Rhizoclosmatium globosum]|uniref:Uncharacterized protein n=1 Tax=Rhizoclosmatium globosum TaxID=329046 RepID=A0A1Y2BZZ5_9FUNG|nr:hypothetical protein BCR33DRAFT_373006 [Rhizoclosmatium globosum]|eukprot:ORY40234.1 hypothetical protein BCR33DRAFT_373006 [Rhizoclosmatium globosum]
MRHFLSKHLSHQSLGLFLNVLIYTLQIKPISFIEFHLGGASCNVTSILGLLLHLHQHAFLFASCSNSIFRAIHSRCFAACAALNSSASSNILACSRPLLLASSISRAISSGEALARGCPPTTPLTPGSADAADDNNPPTAPLTFVLTPAMDSITDIRIVFRFGFFFCSYICKLDTTSPPENESPSSSSTSCPNSHMTSPPELDAPATFGSKSVLSLKS